MDETMTVQQAEAIASLLPALMRQLFVLDDDLAAELPLAQLRVCGILCDGPRPMSTLSRELGVTLSAMTQIADRLERARLVNRVAEDGDRRVRCLQLTDRGESIMRCRQDARIQRVLVALEHLSPQERKQVLGSLELLLSVCTASNEQLTAAVAVPGIAEV